MLANVTLEVTIRLMKKLSLLALVLLSLNAFASPITVDSIHAPSGLTIYSKDATIAVPQTKQSGNLVVSGQASLVNADIASNAAIAFSKLAALDSAKILVGNGSNVATKVAVSGDLTMANTGAFTIGAGKVTEAMQVAPSAEGLHSMRVAKFVYDVATDTGTVGAHTLGVTLPANAIMTRAYFYTKTTVTSTGDNGTLAFHCGAANDLFSAADIDAASGGQGVAGQIFVGVPTGNGISGMSKMAAPCEITATVAVNDLLTGKIDGFVEYVIAE